MHLSSLNLRMQQAYVNSLSWSHSYLHRVIWTVCVALVLMGTVKYLQAQGTRDYGPAESIYTYVGWSWAQGYWPYRDSWDHKGPTVYATAMLRSMLAGNDPNVLGGQDIVLGGLTAVFLAGTAYLLWGRGAGSSIALARGILLWAHWPPEYPLVSTPGSLIALFTTGTIFFA